MSEPGENGRDRDAIKDHPRGAGVSLVVQIDHWNLRSLAGGLPTVSEEVGVVRLPRGSTRYLAAVLMLRSGLLTLTAFGSHMEERGAHRVGDREHPL